MKIDILAERIRETGNPVCVGLDTRVEHIPGDFLERYAEGGPYTLQQAADAIYAYNTALIDGLADLIPSVKIQIACYEMLGVPGMEAFEKTCRYARDAGLIVIADAKRNDIGSTAEAYADAFIGGVQLRGRAIRPFAADFVTVNGYLGSDGVEPFLARCRAQGSGIFVLVKTSNPSSGELQDMFLEDGRRVYEAMADMVDRWGEELRGESGYSGVGAVIGATYPRQLTEMRHRHKHIFFLVPGYGAQGATGKDLRGAFDKDGGGAVVNASRSVLMAWKNGGSFIDAARAEVQRMREDIAGR